MSLLAALAQMPIDDPAQVFRIRAAIVGSACAIVVIVLVVIAAIAAGVFRRK